MSSRDQFCLISNQIIDEGYAKGRAAINGLKMKWMARFGLEKSNRGIRLACRHLISSAVMAQTTQQASVHRSLSLFDGTERAGSPAVERLMTWNGLLTMGYHSSKEGDDVAAHVDNEVDDDVCDDVASYRRHVVVEKEVEVVGDVEIMSSSVKSISIGLFVGNIPLHACPEPLVDDKIAQAFNNSSRTVLSYIAPIVQNGEVIVRPSIDTICAGSRRWKTTAVGYFLGKKILFSPPQGVCQICLARATRGHSCPLKLHPHHTGIRIPQFSLLEENYGEKYTSSVYSRGAAERWS
ncbi:UNVERIFIED_CONTAM: hypothetical protein Sindi_2890600 [Sesamum indicum]